MLRVVRPAVEPPPRAGAWRVAADPDGAGAPRAVAETKRILGRVPGLDRDRAFAEMGRLSAELFSGPDAAEGMAAFREKRLPSWNPDA